MVGNGRMDYFRLEEEAMDKRRNLRATLLGEENDAPSLPSNGFGLEFDLREENHAEGLQANGMDFLFARIC